MFNDMATLVGISFLFKKAFLLVVLSFFILLGVSKADSLGLKRFGKILAVITLAVAIAIVVLTGYKAVTGKSCMLMKWHHKQMMSMEKAPGQMMPQPGR